MKILPIPALKDNYIWAIIDDSARRVVVVDPGASDPVIQFLNDHAYTLSGILITHHHADHTNGIPGLLSFAGKIPVYGSELSPNKWIDHPVKDHDNVHCAHVQAKVISIPGHTLDHTAYHLEADDAVFTGDTLFSAGCGRIFEGTPQMMLSSLNKIAALDDATRIYCGHEYTRANLRFAQLVEPENIAIKTRLNHLPDGCTLPSTLGAEKTFNPFLRSANTDVKLAAETHTGNPMLNEVEVFAAIREWKNSI